jgi:hypothetical protein
MDVGCFCRLPSMAVIDFLHSIHAKSVCGENTNGQRGQNKKITLSKEDGKYITSHTSIQSNSTEAQSNLGHFLHFVCFNASAIFNPMA